jgi:hypothetical protein
MAKESKEDKESKKVETYGYYLYEKGKSHWQCGNIVSASQGYLISKEEHLKSEEDRKAQWKKLEDARIEKEKEKKSKEEKA